MDAGAARVPLGPFEENVGDATGAVAGGERMTGEITAAVAMAAAVDGGALKRARNARLLEAIQAARETMVESEREEAMGYGEEEEEEEDGMDVDAVRLLVRS